MALLSGCERIPNEYKAFLELAPNERHLEMQKMSIEKRIDYYLAGRRYVHPPLIELADDIAKEGKPALPILFNRLRTEQDDLTKSNIIYVFEVMHDAHYSLRNEAEVIHQLKQISIGIKDPRWKSRSEETIRLIVENKSPDR